MSSLKYLRVIIPKRNRRWRSSLMQTKSGTPGLIHNLCQLVIHGEVITLFRFFIVWVNWKFLIVNTEIATNKNNYRGIIREEVINHLIYSVEHCTTFNICSMDSEDIINEGHVKDTVNLYCNQMQSNYKQVEKGLIKNKILRYITLVL